MNKILERVLSDLGESKFIFRNNTLEVQNVVMFWTNFSGAANIYGNSARTFNVAVTPEIADELVRRGWRVKEKVVDDSIPDDVLKVYFVNVKVNMDCAYPPVISLYSEFKGKRSKRTLDISTIGELDRVHISTADCIISEYSSPRHEGKVTGYLKKLSVIQDPEIEFDGKYDDWLDEEA